MEQLKEEIDNTREKNGLQRENERWQSLMALKVRPLHSIETSETKYLVTCSHIIEGLVPNYLSYPLPFASYYSSFN